LFPDDASWKSPVVMSKFSPELLVMTREVSGSYALALGNVDSTTTYSFAPATMAPKLWKNGGDPSLSVFNARVLLIW
jgi:hypothetical protein